MAFVIEDGTGKNDANSYVSVTDADALLEHHSDVVTWNALSTNQKELALRKATEYLDARFRWYGRTYNTTQSLQWPRSKNYDDKGNVMTAGTMPSVLKKATAFLAITAVKEITLLTELSGTGAIKQYFTDGLNVIFDPKTTEEAQFLGTRIIELELLLKNMGELKDLTYIKESRKTEVRV